MILEELLNLGDSLFLKKNEHYIIEGQNVNNIAYIQSGYLRTYQIDFKGRDITTNFHKPKTVCGSYYGFYKRMPSIENILALTNVELRLISYKKLMILFENNLEANIFGRKMLEDICIKKDIRISKLLKLDAEERYLWFSEAYPDLIQNVPIKYIASYLGMRKETISRVRNKIRK